ncbi:MAG: homoserine O-acetyltransferase [Candidatus Dadabacteria bacterium]|nr:MAG: homoserine O-acetyltransferase [Candidatus Dadabacteria bacterium]
MNDKTHDRTAMIVEPQFASVTAEQGPLELECGERLTDVTVCYETWGTLNEERSNAILICHALSGSAHAAGWHDGDDRPGWWHDMIGPGKAFDTDRYFVVCSNVLGGCYGTTGPCSPHPADGRPWGIRFPIVTVRDMVSVQRRLMDLLGIERWFSVAGGSLGGMQALEWAWRYPDRVLSVMPLATSAALSPQGIAFNEVGRQAIMSDPHWNNGDYYDRTQKPDKGLSIARMIGHITYLSDESMMQKFGRRGRALRDFHFGHKEGYHFDVESYLHYKGNQFTQRFDANTYLYVTKAMDLFDLPAEAGSLKSAFRNPRARFLVVSFSSDWLFPPVQSREIVQGLRANLADVTYYEVQSDKGHDAFLIEVDELTQIVRRFLNRVEIKGESHFATTPSKI